LRAGEVSRGFIFNKLAIPSVAASSPPRLRRHDAASNSCEGYAADATKHFGR